MKNLFIEAEKHRRRLEDIIAKLQKQEIYDPLDFFQIAHLIVGIPITTQDGNTYTVTKIQDIIAYPKENKILPNHRSPINESIIYIKNQNGKTSSYHTFFHNKKPNQARIAIDAIQATLTAEWINKTQDTPIIDAIQARITPHMP